MKKTSKSSNKNKVMAFDIFERKYSNEIEMLIEKILDTKDNLNDENYDELYDDAHEEAIYVLAAEKKVSLE